MTWAYNFGSGNGLELDSIHYLNQYWLMISNVLWHLQLSFTGNVQEIDCGLAAPYGDKDLDQHWLRKWLVAWWHQAITWSNVDWSSVNSSDIHIRAISQEIPPPSITKICLKITCLKFHSNFPGANKLIIKTTHLKLQPCFFRVMSYILITICIVHTEGVNLVYK